MRKGRAIIYLLIILLAAGFFFYKYFINIYEATVKVEPKNLFADNQSTVVISVIPLNSFGWKALFRNSPAEFEILEGKSLIEIKVLNNSKGMLILKSRSETGKVVIKIKSEHSLFPMMVEIPIEPNFT